MSASQAHRPSERDLAFLLASRGINAAMAPELLEEMAPGRQEKLQEAWDYLEGQSQLKRLADLKGAHHESLLHSAASEWLTELFQGEPAAVWAILMRDLPKARVGGILKDLPKGVRRDLKSLDLKKIPQAIGGLIQRRAESRFPSFDRSDLEAVPILKELAELDLRTMMKLLRELGLSEMALAFSKVSRSATRAILHRLNKTDAKELKNRMARMKDPPAAAQREAQLHILEMDLDKLSPEAVVHEIGFGVFAKAFGKEDSELSAFFVYRLPPKQGYVLKRYLDENIPKNTPERVKATRQRLQKGLSQMD